MTVSANGVKKQELYAGNIINGQNPATLGLVAQYTFDNISGTTVADETGSYPGTSVNGPTQVAGYLGEALDFVPGSAQYVDCGTAMGTALGNGVGALSVSLWLKTDTLSSSRGIFEIGPFDGNNPSFGLFILNPSLIGMRMIDKPLITTTAFPDATKYHHIVAMYTGAKGQLYIDNTLSIDEANTTDLDLSGLQTSIAAMFDTTTTFDGIIDQVRIYNRELTVAEIGVLYKEKVDPWIFRNGKAA